LAAFFRAAFFRADFLAGRPLAAFFRAVVRFAFFAVVFFLALAFALGLGRGFGLAAAGFGAGFGARSSSGSGADQINRSDSGSVGRTGGVNGIGSHIPGPPKPVPLGPCIMAIAGSLR
jgi:hypothetical protein